MRISPEKRYDELKTHLRYLNEKIIEAFNLFIKMASTIVGGTFFLQWKMTADDPQRVKLAHGTDALMFLVAGGAIVIILNNMRSWIGHRQALSVEFPEVPPMKASAWITEAFLCVLILTTSIVFVWINPL